MDKQKKPFLTTKDLSPENQETPIHFLNEWLTPENLFFIRNHFDYPNENNEFFSIKINGEVTNPITISYDEIVNMPSKEIVAVLECSGNKRDLFNPKTYGEQWEDGAVSQGLWKGVSLYKILSQTNLKSNVREIVFEGHDHGSRTDIEGIFHFSRSLPIEKALHPDTIIAYELNGYPLSFKQGYPLRLVVPGWYGMAWVKWIKSISAINYHFNGPFQDIDYNYYPNKDNDMGKTPVTTINVSSIIQKPLNYATLDFGVIRIKGISWTGLGIIEKVEISTDNGLTWDMTDIVQDETNTYSWTLFEYNWKPPSRGEYTILSKATDSFGRVQPMNPFWNRKGYGYNACYKINVKIE